MIQLFNPAFGCRGLIIPRASMRLATRCVACREMGFRSWFLSRLSSPLRPCVSAGDRCSEFDAYLAFRFVCGGFSQDVGDDGASEVLGNRRAIEQHLPYSRS